MQHSYAVIQPKASGGQQTVLCTSGCKYLKFYPVPLNASPNELTEWKEVAAFLAADFEKLLALSHKRYLSEVLFEETLHLTIDSFLRQASRSLSEVPVSCHREYRQLYNQVYCVILRSSKPEELESGVPAIANYGEHMYHNYVYTIPMLMDFAILYGEYNRDTVSEVLSRIFSLQPKYVEDFKQLLPTIFSIFQNIRAEMDLWAVRRQPATFHPLEISRISDVLDYLVDIGRTLKAFLTIANNTLPDLLSACFALNLPSQLAEFYDAVIPALQLEILANVDLTTTQRCDLCKKLSLSAAAFIEAVRNGLMEPIINQIIKLACTEAANEAVTLPVADNTAASNDKSPHTVAEHIRLLFSILHDFLQSFNFAIAYEVVYPFEEDYSNIEAIINMVETDRTQIEHIRSGFQRAAGARPGEEVKVANPPALDVLLNGSQPQPVAGQLRSDTFHTIKSILPNAEDYIIEGCLNHFSNDMQQVIDAIMDNNIPHELLARKTTGSLNRSEKRQLRKLHALQAKRESTDPGLRNLDIASAAVAEEALLTEDQLWQGKRGETGLPTLSAREKRKVMGMAVSIFDDYDSEPSDTEQRRVADLYNDEYDDTYEVHVGTVEKHLAADSSDDSDGAAPSIENQVRWTVDNRRQSATACSSAAAQQSYDLQHSVNSCQKLERELDPQDVRMMKPHNVLSIENPEVVRHRKQAHRAQQQANRRGHRGGFSHSGIPRQPLPPLGSFEPPQATRRSGWFGPPQMHMSGYHHDGRRQPDNVETTPCDQTPASGIRQTVNVAARRQRGGRSDNHSRRFLADKKRQLY